jgi:hypothetical protein
LRKRWKSGSKKPFPRPMQLLSLRVPIITRRVVAIWSIFEFVIRDGPIFGEGQSQFSAATILSIKSSSR